METYFIAGRKDEKPLDVPLHSLIEDDLLCPAVSPEEDEGRMENKTGFLVSYGSGFRSNLFDKLLPLAEHAATATLSMPV